MVIKTRISSSTVGTVLPIMPSPDVLIRQLSAQDREELVCNLLQTLSRPRLVAIRKKIDPLLHLDIIGHLPDEVALLVLSFLPWQSLLKCSLVSRRWRALADDSSLWKLLCRSRGCDWKQPARTFDLISPSISLSSRFLGDTDDEGVGDEEDVTIHNDFDSGFMSVDVDDSITGTMTSTGFTHANLSSFAAALPAIRRLPSTKSRHSAPSALPTMSIFLPNYKLLHQIHTRIHNRFLCSSYRLSTLQTHHHAPKSHATHSPHTNMIYCLQLYTYPQTGVQTLFTGSKDKSIREWNLQTSCVIRVVEGVHSGSILSLCVNEGLLASAGSDRKVGVWDLDRNALSRCIRDHEDSVLCVRFDDRRLVSCSKDRTLRTYLLPDFKPHLVLMGHRAAVNAVALSENWIISASGDRSMAIWDANTGQLVRAFENHHSRGIASIDFKPPFILSGSSDKHIRLIDMNNGTGWSTNAEFDQTTCEAWDMDGEDEDYVTVASASVCGTCGTEVSAATLERLGGPGSKTSVIKFSRYSSAHRDLVRSVVMGNDWVVSGSYDCSVKVWNRKTGAFVAELAGGHTGKIFCVGFDGTKIVSVGEDQRICIWDFAHGIDTSFIKL